MSRTPHPLAAGTLVGVSLALLAGCSESGRGSGANLAGPIDGGQDVADGARPTFADDPPEIDPRYVSNADTSPTLAAVAAGVDPTREFVPDVFECHDADDTTVLGPDLLVTIDASGGYATPLGGGRVEIPPDEDADTRRRVFRGGPLDGERTWIRFDRFGQTFEVDEGRRELHCFQRGASAERAARRFRLNTPEPADYACRDLESGATATLRLGTDGRYEIGGQGGRVELSDIVDGSSSRLDFDGGPFDGERAFHRADPDSGYRRFGVRTSTVHGIFPVGVSSELEVVCERVGEPLPFAEYGHAPAPPAPGTPLPLAGLYHVEDSTVGPNLSYFRAEYFRFGPDGRVFVGVPHRSGIDCRRTRPNGLPYCDTYTVRNGELAVRSAVDGSVRTWPIALDDARVTAIDGEPATAVSPLAPATVLGRWQNLYYSQTGCIGDGYCSSTFVDRQLVFGADGRFASLSSDRSISSLDTAIGSTTAFASGNRGVVGGYAVEGNALLLR